MSGAARTGPLGHPGGSWGILAVGLMLCTGLIACDGGAEEPTPDAAATSDARPGPTRDAGGEPTDAAVASGWIELGTGARSFEPLEAGQEVPIIAGIQGGFHVWGGFRGGGFDDSDVELRFWLTLDGQTIARANYSEFGLPTDRSDPTVFDYGGVAVVYESNDMVQRTSGEAMVLNVEVTSLADRQVMSDSIAVVPLCCE